ncbi:DUF1853 family protein [Halomonas sp. V046]|uniref:DUF1853 family protein n=1 Tax=Halomonas sp. V046 TaxID=3459611 RepID=UPI004044ADBC
MPPFSIIQSAPQIGALKHPLVRDLAWLVDAPDLVATRWAGRPSRADLGLGDGERLRRWLEAIAAAPGRLETLIGDTAFTRLGQYHERLWQYLLDSAPGTALLANNVRIQQERRTLGELDILYRQRDSGDIVHLEVAIKFYLGLETGPGAADDATRWIGPGGLDSLALKAGHVSHHQLPLMHTAAAQQALATALSQPLKPPESEPASAALSRPPRSQLAMPGLLFYPWRDELPPPAIGHANAYHGLWCRWSDWSALCASCPELRFGTCLAKPHWLAPPLPEHWLPRDTLSRSLAAHFATYATPVQLMLARHPSHFADTPLAPGAPHDKAPPGGTGRRVFVVADDWPKQIPLAPRQHP